MTFLTLLFIIVIALIILNYWLIDLYKRIHLLNSMPIIDQQFILFQKIKNETDKKLIKKFRIIKAIIISIYSLTFFVVFVLTIILD